MISSKTMAIALMITLLIFSTFGYIVMGTLKIGKANVAECQRIGCMYEKTYHNEDGSTVAEKNSVI